MTKIELELKDLADILRSPSGVRIEPLAPSANRDFGLAIVIADRGHVWIGRVTLRDGFATITHGAAIRIWGTTKGLGQLVKTGPTEYTKLDPVPVVIVRDDAVIAYLPCEEAPWNGKL